MDRMKKIKRQLSMTLRGGRGPAKSLGEPRDGPRSDGEAGPDEGRMGSDGESDPPSGTSSDEVASPVRVRLRHHPRVPSELPVLTAHRFRIRVRPSAFQSLVTIEALRLEETPKLTQSKRSLSTAP